jgi:flagellin
MRVNFNYEASSTHTAYLANQREMGKSLLRLSTGMRILEASDDAAGLFIADQLSIVATGLQEGNRNISTGISALRIAENASGQIFDRLKGIYSRAIRAANDINDPNARTALQREVANLISKRSEQTQNTTASNSLMEHSRTNTSTTAQEWIRW